METSKLAIQKLAKDVDVILVQEHWYFDCQLSRLNTVCDDLLGVGKATDTGDPFFPVQMPRGYSGTGILWQKKLDHLITPIADGGHRIQCVELQGKLPILITSVDMPCRGVKVNVNDFEDCLSQLQELVTKYQYTHAVLMLGDFNEDLSNTPKSRRTKSLEIFLSDYHLGTIPTNKTYVSSSGADTSTIDCIFFSRDLANKMRRMETLIDQHANVSDHYPVCCSLE